MKINKYHSKKRNQSGGRRKTKKKINSLADNNQLELSDNNIPNNYPETKDNEIIKINDLTELDNLLDINDKKLLVSDNEIDLIANDLPTLKFDQNYKYDLLNSHPEKPLFYDTFNKSSLKISNGDKKKKSSMLSTSDLDLIEQQTNQSKPSELSSNDLALIQLQTNEPNPPELSSNDLSLINQQSNQNIGSLISESQNLNQSTIDNSVPSSFESILESSVQSPSKKIKKQSLLRDINLNTNSLKKEKIENPFQIIEDKNKQKHNHESEHFSLISNNHEDSYEIIRDLKIIKIINDSEIFSEYCGNNQVSKRDVMASVNANYYRVIESINKLDSNVKINSNYDYTKLTSLFNKNRTRNWSKISLNLLKKFYNYITGLIFSY